MISAKDACTLSSAYFNKHSAAELEKVKKQIEADIEAAIKKGSFSILIPSTVCEFSSTLNDIDKWLKSLGYKTKKTMDFIGVSWI